MNTSHGQHTAPGPDEARTKPMDVYLMRHGQTNYNVLGLCNDDPADEVHLTQRGIRQAEEAALQLKDAPIELIFVSRLPRTRQTAEIVNRHHRVDIVQNPAIDDLHTGFNGRPSAQHQRAIAHDRLRTKPPGGESLLEHKRRVLAFVEGLKGLSQQTVVVIAHEETVRVGVAHFRELSDREMCNVVVGNCQIFHFKLDRGPSRRSG